MRPSCPELPTIRARLMLAEGALPRLVGAARSSFATTREFGFRPEQHEERFSRRKEGGRSKAVLEASAFTPDDWRPEVMRQSFPLEQRTVTITSLRRTTYLGARRLNVRR